MLHGNILTEERSLDKKKMHGQGETFNRSCFKTQILKHDFHQ